MNDPQKATKAGEHVPLNITKENLLLIIPPALTHDPSVMALAASGAEALAARPEEIDRLRIYPDIDRLDEKLLDILAYDFKVDWWDMEYTLEEKRQTLKDSWRVHKLLGTKAAVVTAISAIYHDTRVLEWWEYGGEPYHFKLLINAAYENVDPEKHQRVLDRVKYYKNLRSHNDGVTYYIAQEQSVSVRAAAAAAGQFTAVSAVAHIRGRDPHHFELWKRAQINAGTGPVSTYSVVTAPPVCAKE